VDVKLTASFAFRSRRGRSVARPSFFLNFLLFGAVAVAVMGLAPLDILVTSFCRQRVKDWGGVRLF